MIVDLAPDCHPVLIGPPSRTPMWLIARERRPPAAEYRQLLDAAKAEGFPVNAVCKVPQQRADLGPAGHGQP